MSEIVVAQTPAGSSQDHPLADCSPVQGAELRYLNAVFELFDHAVENKSLRALVNVLTWTLARITLENGPAAAGDILHRLGVHLGTFAERRSAQEEAQKAKEEGRVPH